MLKSMVTLTFSLLDRIYPSWTNLVQKIKMICLRLHWVPRLTQIYWIRWWTGEHFPYLGPLIPILDKISPENQNCLSKIKVGTKTNSSNENLFRFETQIHMRYFKSLPIAAYYLTTIYMKNLYLHSKTYNMGLKWNLYLTSLSRCGPVNPSIPTFGNINLTESITNLILA